MEIERVLLMSRDYMRLILMGDSEIWGGWACSRLFIGRFIGRVEGVVLVGCGLGSWI